MSTSQEIDGLFTKVKRSFRDLATSLDMNPVTEDVIQLKDERAVTQSIKNLVLTKFGEKLMDPTIGCDVHSMLFEPLDVFSAMEIETKIINTIGNFEPRVQILNLKCTAVEDGQDAILVEMTFRIIGEPNIIEQQFLLERPSS